MDVDEQERDRQRPVQARGSHTTTTPLLGKGGYTNDSPQYPNYDNVGMSSKIRAQDDYDRHRRAHESPSTGRPTTHPSAVDPYFAGERRIHPPRQPWASAPDQPIATYPAYRNLPRPPPLHTTSNGRNTARQYEQPNLRSPSFPHHSSYPRNTHYSHPYNPSNANGSRPNSSSSRTQLPPLSSYPAGPSVERTKSARSARSTPMSRRYSQNGSTTSRLSSAGSSIAEDHEDNGGPSSAPFDTKRRTRALMTKNQLAELRKKWKTNKFPGNEDREILGRQVGLTPRQVQVWFQNQRQKVRKEINDSNVPADADPADYEGLDKSPRSRKLDLDAAGDPRAQISSSSSELSDTLRAGVTVMGIMTPRDDDSRSIATGSSIGGHYHTLPNDSDFEPHPMSAAGQQYWDQSRVTESHPPRISERDQLFAFHKPPTPTTKPLPPSHPLSDRGRSYTNPESRYHGPSSSHHPSDARLPQVPPPLRHAATLEGAPLSRRRSNSLEDSNRGNGREQVSPRSALPQSRHSIQPAHSQLPPSLAALVLPGPVDMVSPREPPSQRAPMPTLPPPRGWVPERMDGQAQARSTADPSRGNGSAALPSIFGTNRPSDPGR